MTSFLIPCLCMLVTFWISCYVMYRIVKGQIAPIVRSIRRIERQLGGGRNTQEFITEPIPPPPPPHPRYVTVERGIKHHWERQQQ